MKLELESNEIGTLATIGQVENEFLKELNKHEQAIIKVSLTLKRSKIGFVFNAKVYVIDQEEMYLLTTLRLEDDMTKWVQSILERVK
jgi:hypothetical protein